jgi:hypothetical protein
LGFWIDSVLLAVAGAVATACLIALATPAAGLPPRAALWTEGPKPGSRGTAVASRREGETLVFEAGDTQGRLVYVVAEP